MGEFTLHGEVSSLLIRGPLVRLPELMDAGINIKKATSLAIRRHGAGSRCTATV